MQAADHVISTNDSYREIVLGRDGVDPADVTVVRTGPDLTRLRRTAPDPSSAAAPRPIWPPTSGSWGRRMVWISSCGWRITWCIGSAGATSASPSSDRAIASMTSWR